MKPFQKPATSLNQGTIPPLTLNDAILPLYQIRGIASLFSVPQDEKSRELNAAACLGIRLTLDQAADDIQNIINDEITRREKKRQAIASARERQAQKLYDIRCGEVAR